MRRLSLLLLFFLVPTVEAVVISEFMYDLDGSDNKREWIEIYNQDSAADLSNWKFYEAETNHRLKLVQGSFTIPSGGFAVIADNNQSFLADSLDYSGTLFDSSFSLSNSGEELSIKDSEDEVVDTVDYSSGQGAAGNGKSLQLIGNEWLACEPTPGEENKCEKAKEIEEPEEEEEIIERAEEEQTEPEPEPKPELISEPDFTETLIAEEPEPVEPTVYCSEKQGVRLPVLMLLFVSLLLNLIFIVKRK